MCPALDHTSLLAGAEVVRAAILLPSLSVLLPSPSPYSHRSAAALKPFPPLRAISALAVTAAPFYFLPLLYAHSFSTQRRALSTERRHCLAAATPRTAAFAVCGAAKTKPAHMAPHGSGTMTGTTVMAPIARTGISTAGKERDTLMCLTGDGGTAIRERGLRPPLLLHRRLTRPRHRCLSRLSRRLRRHRCPLLAALA